MLCLLCCFLGVLSLLIVVVFRMHEKQTHIFLFHDKSFSFSGFSFSKKEEVL